MTDKTIKYNVVVDDNGGTKKLVSSATELKGTMDGVAKSAERVAQATTKQASATQTLAKAKAASMPSNERVEYDIARSGVGTGAAGRDFANQAQGLGGLVRLYAVYAANVFAVSTAFNALKNAADTTNLVRGLDTLGAASGRNLGELSKRLVAATDGAISLRDAMTATAQTSAAGLSGQNIQRLAVVAKNASFALGVSMPDALNRLSRGITKLEPELLDELGIFTKIDPAVQQYARSIGKAAGQLTDFERRQAFALAVLKEGEDKFGELGEAGANSYDKLLASLQNVAQKGLELVNVVLKPIVDILASSPVALAAGIATIGTLLVKQALPAIGEFKEGLAGAAEKAKNIAIKKAKDAEDAKTKLQQLALAEREALAEKQGAKLDAAQDRLVKAGVDKSNAVFKLAQANVADLSEKNLKEINRQISAVRTQAAKFDTKALASADPQQIQALKNKAEAYRFTASAAEQAIAAEKQYAKTASESQKQNAVANLNAKAAAASQIDSVKRQIVSNAAYNASLIGFTGSLKLARDEISKSGIEFGRLEKAALATKVGLAAVGGAISTLGGILNSFLGAIGLITAIFGILDSVLSKNSKQMAKFEQALDSANSSIDNVDRTLANIQSKGDFAATSIKSTMALANAFGEVADAAEQALISSGIAKGKMSAWDKLFDDLFSSFGGGIDKNLAKTIAGQLDSALSILTRSGIGQQYEKTFKELLNVSSLDIKTVADAFDKLSKEGKDKFIKVLQQARTEIANSASRLESFKSATEGVTKAYQEFVQSTAISDPFFKLGQSLDQLASTSIKVVLGGVGEIDKAFKELAESPEKAALFGPDFVNQLVGVSQEFLNNVTAINQNAQALEELAKKEEALQDKLDKRKAALTGTRSGLLNSVLSVQTGTPELRQEAENLAEQRRLLQKAASTASTEGIEKARNLFVKGIEEASKKGAQYTEQALGNANAKAAIIYEKATLQVLSGARKAIAEASITKRELALKEQEIDLSVSIINSQDNLAAKLEEANALAAQRNLIADPKASEQDKAAAALRVETSQLYNKLLATGDTGATNLGNVIKDASAAAKAIVTEQVRQRNSKELGQQAARKVLAGEQKAASLSAQVGVSKGELEDNQRFVDLQDSITKALQDQTNIRKNIVGFTTDSVQLEQDKLEKTLLQNAQTKEADRLLNDITNAQRLGNAQGAEEAKILSRQLELVYQRQEVDTKNLELKQTLQSKLDKELKSLQLRQQVLAATENQQFAARAAGLEIDRARITSAAELFGTDEKLVQQQLNALDLAQLQLDRDRAVAEAKRQYLNQEQELRTKLIASGVTDESQLQQEIANRLALQKQASDVAVASADQELNKRKEILDITNQLKLKQLEYNETIRSATEFADTLKNAFGDLGNNIGEGIGNLIITFAEFGVQTDKNAKALEEFNKRVLEKGDLDEADPKDVKERAKLEKKLRDDELKGFAQIAGASKKLFSEKTAAAKGFAVIEKGLHLIRLANMAQEVGATLANTATKIAAHLGESAVLGTKAVVNALSALPPPFSFAAAAATAAVVGKLLGKRVSVDPNAKIGAEEQQKVQGTAMGYNQNAELVQVRRGVFGDTDAKSESIANSLEILKENSIEGLSLNNRMLKALERLSKAIDDSAKGLYQIAGIRTGSLSGTIEGTNTSGGLFGINQLFGKKVTKEIIDSGIELKGTFLDLVNGVGNTVQLFEKLAVTTKKSGFLGIGGSTKTAVEETLKSLDITDPQQQKALKDITNVFQEGYGLLLEVGRVAGKTEAEITQVLSTLRVDQRASLRGLTGEDLAKELQSIFSAILDDAAGALFSTFEKYADFGEGLLETVVRVLDTNTKIDQALKNIGITASLAKQFDITEALAAGAGGLSEFIDQIDFFSENFLTAAERVSISATAVNREMFDLAATTKDLTAEQLFALAQGTNLTSEQFKDLVQGLDVTTEAGQILYKALMTLAPAFKEVVNIRESERNKLLEEYNDLVLTNTEKLEAQRNALHESNRALFDQVQALKAAQDKVTQARTALTNSYNREKSALDSLKSKFTSAFDNIKKALQDITGGPNALLSPQEQYQQDKSDFERILQLSRFGTGEEQAKALSELPNAANKLLESSKTFNASSDAYFTDFNLVTSALQSASNIAEEQVSETQKLINSLDTQYNAVMGNTDAILTFSQALANYTQALSDLDALKRVPAVAATLSIVVPPPGAGSSAQEPTTLIPDVGTPRVTDPYAGEGGTASGVGNVYVNPRDIGFEELGNYFFDGTGWRPFEAIQERARGGYASGLTLVGEQGPELVDFSNPGMVYTANQTRDMFMPQANMSRLINGLTDEVQRLRSELRELRQDQQRQTGDIIMSNYDANNRAADTIGNSVEQAVVTKEWTARAAVTIK